VGSDRSPGGKGKSAGKAHPTGKVGNDKEEGVGDHDDLPNDQKFLQLRRLHGQDQPLEQLDEVIEEIRELMLKSAHTASREQLGRRKEATAAAAAEAAATTEWSGWKLQRLIWDPGGFPNSYRGSS
jgi:hypothetical protein